MTSIVIKNKKILNFYANNPNINFEAVNLIFIDLFDNLLQDMNSTMNSTINSQILSNVENLKSEVSSLSSSVSKLNEDISNSVYIRFQESKREYIEDMKSIMSTSFSHNGEKMNQLIQQNTSQLVDKTTFLLNEVVPQSNEKYYEKMIQSIDTFHKSISEDTQKLLKSTDKNESLTQFLSAFELKSNNLLQPVFSFINASEERINNNLNSIKEDSSKTKIFDELSEFLGKYKNSSYKGQFGENQLETVLNKLFPTAEVINSTGMKACCDFRINRNELPVILIETKNYDRNVSLDEVKKFIRDIELQKCHGIFLSQHSGITSKQNFQIDIKGQNIMVYVHNVDYCPHTIKIATDIIDSLSGKLSEIEETVDDISISKEIIDDINKEYSQFIERKHHIIEIVKEFTKKMTNEVEDIKFPSLSKFLVSKCGNILNNENEVIICNICNQFQASNNKALSAHQRACKKKNIQNTSNINIKTEKPNSLNHY
jgi:hypothetical protein